MDSRSQVQIDTLATDQDLGLIVIGKKAVNGRYDHLPLNEAGTAVATEPIGGGGGGVDPVGLKNIIGAAINPATEDSLVNVLKTSDLSFDGSGYLNVNVQVGGGGGIDPVGIKNVASATINPATEDKQDDIITAIGGIGGADPVGLKDTGANPVNPATSDNQLPDDHNVTVSNMIPAVETGLATSANQLPDDHNVNVSNMIPAVETGLATSANQLPDGHEVEVNNFPTEYPLPAAQVSTLTPPAAITGFATEAKQLPNNHDVVVTAMPPVSVDVSALAKEVTLADLYNQLCLTLDRLEYGTQTDQAKRLRIGSVSTIDSVTTIVGFGASASVAVSEISKYGGVPASRQSEAISDIAFTNGILSNISF